MTRYARMRGVAPVSIWQAVQEGRIRTVNNRIDVAEADATWYQRHLRANDGLRSGAASEAKRDRAVLTRTVANVQMTRRKAERLRQRLVERAGRQAAMADVATETRDMLRGLNGGKRVDVLGGEIIKAIATDLGDMNAEALRVLRDGAKS
jgi:hypothetical protein